MPFCPGFPFKCFPFGRKPPQTAGATKTKLEWSGMQPLAAVRYVMNMVEGDRIHDLHLDSPGCPRKFGKLLSETVCAFHLTKP